MYGCRMVGDTPKYANYEAKYNFGSGLIAYLSDKLIANFLIIFGPLQTLELRYVNLSNKTELRTYYIFKPINKTAR